MLNPGNRKFDNSIDTVPTPLSQVEVSEQEEFLRASISPPPGARENYLDLRPQLLEPVGKLSINALVDLAEALCAHKITDLSEAELNHLKLVISTNVILNIGTTKDLVEKTDLIAAETSRKKLIKLVIDIAANQDNKKEVLPLLVAAGRVSGPEMMSKVISAISERPEPLSDRIEALNRLAVRDKWVSRFRDRVYVKLVDEYYLKHGDLPDFSNIFSVARRFLFWRTDLYKSLLNSTALFTLSVAPFVGSQWFSTAAFFIAGRCFYNIFKIAQALKQFEARFARK